MNTQKSLSNGAVSAHGNGLTHALRRFVGKAVTARHKRHATEELDQLPDHLKQDIDWPATAKHEEH